MKIYNVIAPEGRRLFC